MVVTAPPSTRVAKLGSKLFTASPAPLSRLCTTPCVYARCRSQLFTNAPRAGGSQVFTSLKHGSLLPRIVLAPSG